jgi:hypothetical protein
MLIFSGQVPAQAQYLFKKKVYVPVTPVYANQTGVAAQAPMATYSYAPVAATPSYAPVAGAPLAAAPASNVYYAPTAGAPVSMAPQPFYSPAVYAPQGSGTGASFAPTGSSFFGNVPPGISGSRMSEEGRRDVFEDMRHAYRDSKTSESSRTALRKSLRDQTSEKYVEVLGDVAPTVDDLNDAEKKEIGGIVDAVMREDSSSNGASASGSPNQYGYPTQYGYPNSNAYGGGYPPQPFFYYFIYPLVPVAQPHHPHAHHLFHHQ